MEQYYKKIYVRKRMAVLGLLLLLLLLIGLLTKSLWRKKIGKVFFEKNTVTIQGKEYIPRSDIKTCLIIGVDKDKANEKESFADTLQLLVITPDAYVRIPIDRNTICTVPTVDEDGNELGKTSLQIAYAHTSGDGSVVSCENTVRAVSGLFYDVPIEEYACFGMETIPKLNHFADGVTVTVEDALPTIPKGTIHLTDEQAYEFVHSRRDVADGSNENRMKRQDAYLHGLMGRFKEKTLSDEEFPVMVYQDLKPQMVTSLTAGNISRFAKSIIEKEDLGEKKITGTSGEDTDGFASFTPDKDSIDEIALQYFFEEY